MNTATQVVERKTITADFVRTAEEVRKQRMINNLLNDDMRILIPYLKEKTVTDISLPDSGEIIISRFRQPRDFTGIVLPDYIVERIIKAVAAISGRSLDVYSGFPILEANIPVYNARLTALMEPNTCRPELQIRKPPEIIYTLEEYVEHGEMTQAQYDCIVGFIKNRANIMVSGATGSGKTTLTNAILYKMVELTPKNNFYIVEDTYEIQCKARMKTQLVVPKELTYKAVEEAKRFSPDRIIFGEVRNALVCRSLLEAWEDGSDGNVTTVHASNCKVTLLKIKSWLGSDMSFMAEHLSDVIQLIVHIKRTIEGIRVDELYPLSEETDNFLAGIHIQENIA